MAKISKNSRNATKTEIFNHKNCKGILRMKTLMKKGKMRHYAECERCNVQSRTIKDLI